MNKKNIIFLHGENTLGVIRATKKICRSFANKHSQNEIIELDWESADINLIDAKIFATPLFTSKQLIKLGNFLSNSPIAKALIGRIKNIPQSTLLLFYETKPLDKRKKIFREIKSLAGVNKDFPLPQPYQLPEFIRKLAKEKGVEIEPNAVETLKIAIGNNPLLLNNELEKLSHFNRPITSKEVIENVGSAIDYSLFDVIDLIVANRKAKAWQKLDKLLLAGQSPWLLLANLVGVLRGAYLLSAKRVNYVSYEFAKQAGLSAFFLNKILPFANKHRPEQILTKLKNLLALDQNLKTGKIEIGVAIDIAVANMF